MPTPLNIMPTGRLQGWKPTVTTGAFKSGQESMGGRGDEFLWYSAEFPYLSEPPFQKLAVGGDIGHWSLINAAALNAKKITVTWDIVCGINAKSGSQEFTISRPDGARYFKSGIVVNEAIILGETPSSKSIDGGSIFLAFAPQFLFVEDEAQGNGWILPQIDGTVILKDGSDYITGHPSDEWETHLGEIRFSGVWEVLPEPPYAGVTVSEAPVIEGDCPVRFQSWSLPHVEFLGAFDDEYDEVKGEYHPITGSIDITISEAFGPGEWGYSIP